MKKVFRVLTLTMALMLLFPSTVQAKQVHRVAPRESLFRIAQMYGITVDEVIDQNRYLRNPGAIFPGQVLIIPIEADTSVYHVKPGDTLHEISQKFRVPMAQIATVNQLQNWSVLHVGQVLTIPSTQFNQPESHNTYTVQRGDTLYGISQRLGIPMADIAQRNSLSDWNTLHVGQVLQISETTRREPEPEFQYTVAEMLRMFPDIFYRKGQGNGNQIALTFDDGPNTTYTPQILDILQQYNVPATFFVMGSRVERHPEVAQRIVREGHIIGNHTWSHPDLRRISNDRLVDEMNRTENVITRTTGQRPALMRPPYGAISPTVLQGLKDLEYKVINWSVDSVDWRDQDVDQILVNTLPDIRGNDIVLFHDAGGDQQSRAATVAVLPELIETLKMQGYEFVTVDQLLNVSAYR